MEASKKGFLPMTHGISLSKEMCPSTSQERERMSQIPYASAIGSIMYAMICTRPDLSYALSMTSRYQANPGEGHWVAVKNILKYLRRTKDVFLVYGGEEQLSIKGYTDASFQTDKDDSRSQSGFVFRLNGGAVSWKSSKQDTVADSTTEAEYIAASEAAKEAVWIKKFVTELGVVPSISDALELYCDNNGAIAQAKEPRSHQRSKHILRRFHLIREIVDRGDVEICKVHTDDNIVDPLTKPLSKQKHDRHTESLGGVMVTGAVMGVCQSKMSSSDRLMGSVWPSSTNGSAADAAAGGGAIWLRSCRMCSGGVSVARAGDGGFSAGGLGGVTGVDAKLVGASGVWVGLSMGLAAGGVGIAVWSGTASVRSILRMYSFHVQPDRSFVYLSVGRLGTAARRQRAEMIHGNTKMPLSF
ncbi:hypothetical protein V6N13_108541 [Hibiscus sabdariffa]